MSSEWSRAIRSSIGSGAGSGQCRLSLALDDASAAPEQVVGRPPEALEGRIARLTVVVTVIDLLNDGGKTEQTVDLVEGPVVNLEPHPAAVVVDDLLARHHSGDVRRLAAEALQEPVVIGLDPIGQGVSEIHQRIAQGRHLPVQHADDFERVLGREDDVVEAVVAVDHPDAFLFRDVGRQPAHDLLSPEHVPGPSPAKTLRPALDLAPIVARAFPQRLKARCLHIDRMQLDQPVDGPPAERRRLRRVQVQPGRQIGAQNNPFNALHEIEVAADNGFIRAESDHLRHLRIDRFERFLDVVFANHIVSGLCLRARRWPAKNQIPVGVAKAIGQVGRALGKLSQLRMTLESVNVRFQPLVHGVDIEAVLFAQIARLVNQRLGRHCW